MSKVKYDPVRSERKLKERERTYRHGVALAIAAAYGGKVAPDVEPICAILENEDRDLSMRDRRELAKFFRRRVTPTSTSGKRPGAVPGTAEDAINIVLDGVRSQLAREKEQQGLKRSKPGRKDELVEEHHKRLVFDLHPKADRLDVPSLKRRVKDKPRQKRKRAKVVHSPE